MCRLPDSIRFGRTHNRPSALSAIRAQGIMILVPLWDAEIDERKASVRRKKALEGEEALDRHFEIKYRRAAAPAPRLANNQSDSNQSISER